MVKEAALVGRQEGSFFSASAVRCSPALYLVASIANLGEIEGVFGHEACADALDRLRAEMRRLFPHDRIIELDNAGAIEAMVDAKAREGQDLAGRLLNRLCAALGSRPIMSERGPFFIVPSLGVAEIGAREGDVERARVEARGQIAASGSAGNGCLDISRYQEDMRRCASLLEKVDRGGAALVWQSVVSPDHNARLLYFEGLLRICGDDGELHACEAEIRALERVGLAPELDRRMMALVLDHLEADPVMRLGVNISATSASLHRYGRFATWCDLLSRLERHPELARRLVIEITETAEILSLDEAGEFISRMQDLGCLVAIDDFGAGRASVMQTATLLADIIKIDGGFIRNAMQDERRHATFEHLVGLARSLARAVVVEGVETADQAELARHAGAQWLQGYHFGRPSLTRALSAPPEARTIWALGNFRDRFQPLPKVAQAG